MTTEQTLDPAELPAPVRKLLELYRKLDPQAQEELRQAVLARADSEVSSGEPEIDHDAPRPPRVVKYGSNTLRSASGVNPAPLSLTTTSA